MPKPSPQTLVALFRGINVGGKHVIRMKDLVALLEGLDLREVRTYIQSGNAVFESSGKRAPALATSIAAAVQQRRGFRPEVLVLPVSELQRAVAENPFPEAIGEPNRLHVLFLTRAPANPDLTALERLSSKGERFSLEEKRFYLHAPEGIGKSKLAGRIEASLGVPGTARNWRTITKLLELAATDA